MQITEEAKKIIENYCRMNWAAAPKQSKEDAEYVQDVAIAAATQLLTNPELLKAQGLIRIEWFDCERSLPEKSGYYPCWDVNLPTGKTEKEVSYWYSAVTKNWWIGADEYHPQFWRNEFKLPSPPKPKQP